MKNPLKTPSSNSLGLLLARLPIGAFFLLAGYSKIKMGIANFVETASHSPRVPASVSPQLVSGYLHALPFLEILVGAVLIIGLSTRVAGLLGALMVISFIVCFTGLESQGSPFTPNLIYAGILLLVFFAGPGRVSLDGLIIGRRAVQV